MKRYRNIFERLYELSEADASRQASYSLLGSLILYPAVNIPIPSCSDVGGSDILALCTVWLPCRSLQTSTGHAALAHVISAIDHDMLRVASSPTTMDPHSTPWCRFICIGHWIRAL